MQVLVLGGGRFLGFHLVEAALAAGHEVTVFGRSGRPPVPGVEVLVGDRYGDLSSLPGRSWDFAVDTFTDERPGAPAVAVAARLLRDAVSGYAYVSGMSVYAPHGPDVPDESAPVRQLGQQDDRLQARSIAKLDGEAAVRQQFADRALFPRVGIMVGPRGRRFTYWPLRMAAAVDGRLSRRVLVPGDLDRTVQYSDARDIAPWVVSMLARGRGGTYNTVGPGRADSLRTVLMACLRAVGATLDDVELVVGQEARLRRKLVGIDEEDRPLWFPEDQIPQVAIDSAAALQHGLVFRSADATAAETLAWARAEGYSGLTDGRFVELEPFLIRDQQRR